jgi:hypothetical protein
MTNLRGLIPRTLRRTTLIAGLLVLLLNVGSSSAATPIEGIWSFGGGAVEVIPGEEGTFEGVVVAPTNFAVCEHPVGQTIWRSMKVRPDGSYWGFHQWYRGENCQLDPRRGKTAWRVLQGKNGAKVLIVCFANPGEKVQPTISADGKVENATYGCVESAPLTEVPGGGGGGSGGGKGGGGETTTPKFKEVVTLPTAGPASACRRTLSIIPHSPKGDPLKRVVVRIAGKKVAVVTGVKRLHRKIVLATLPEGTFRVTVLATTVLGKHLRGSRVYRGCEASIPAPGKHGTGGR